jgi:hypothetical protein
VIERSQPEEGRLQRAWGRGPGPRAAGQASQRLREGSIQAFHEGCVADGLALADFQPLGKARSLALAKPRLNGQKAFRRVLNDLDKGEVWPGHQTGTPRLAAGQARTKSRLKSTPLAGPALHGPKRPLAVR